MSQPTNNIREEIEQIVWELHGQHQADFHIEETEDIKNDLKEAVDQLTQLFEKKMLEVIGEDEPVDIGYEIGWQEKLRGRNELRAELRSKL